MIAGAEVREELVPSCTLSVSDDSVSVINDGGSVGLLVELSGAGKETFVSATSSSPENVDVRIEPENGSAVTRRFFLIKSISPTVGLYEVPSPLRAGRPALRFEFADRPAFSPPPRLSRSLFFYPRGSNTTRIRKNIAFDVVRSGKSKMLCIKIPTHPANAPIAMLVLISTADLATTVRLVRANR